VLSYKWCGGVGGRRGSDELCSSGFSASIGSRWRERSPLWSQHCRRASKSSEKSMHRCALIVARCSLLAAGCWLLPLACSYPVVLAPIGALLLLSHAPLVIHRVCKEHQRCWPCSCVNPTHLTSPHQREPTHNVIPTALASLCMGRLAQPYRHHRRHHRRHQRRHTQIPTYDHVVLSHSHRPRPLRHPSDSMHALALSARYHRHQARVLWPLLRLHHLPRRLRVPHVCCMACFSARRASHTVRRL
jgi:hypothetical protein